MINLNRTKNNRWIFQKNINSLDLIIEFLNSLKKFDDNLKFGEIKNILKNKNKYNGRSIEGSNSTMQVRLSQICFYMFGYTIKDKNTTKFFPSVTTKNFLDKNVDKNSLSKNSLINFFSLQFPHPFSNTNPNFKIFIGRLLIKLLTDEKIEKKLYIDEFIWFLPFIENINENTYNELINSILDFRRKTFNEKNECFKSINNYDEIFSNILHEVKYYFLKIFESANVLKIIPDINHNNGNIFKFRHGNTNTFRTDSYKARENYSGYVVINENVYDDALKLIKNFSPFETPTFDGCEECPMKNDWLIYLYNLSPLKYIDCLEYEKSEEINFFKHINTMVHESKYGTKDGTSFEQSILPIIKKFEQTVDAEIISGAGNTDITCIINDTINDKDIKINFEAKTRKNSLSEINARRINNHLQKHHSDFCVVIAPKFSTGTQNDIFGNNIVLINSNDFANYCIKEFQNSKTGFIDFMPLLEIIKNNLGKNITENIREYLNKKNYLYY